MQCVTRYIVSKPFNNYNIIVKRFLFIEIGVEHDELIKSRGYIRL